MHAPEVSIPRSLLGLVLAGLSQSPPPSAQARLESALQEPHEDDLPLILLMHALALEPTDLLLVRLALAVEEDLAVGRSVAQLQHPVGGSRPVLGLAAELLRPYGVQGVAAVARSAAFEVGLLQLGEPAAPLAERPVAVAPEIVCALRGYVASGLGNERLPQLGAELRAQAQRYGEALQDSEVTLVLRTPQRAEGLAVAREIARSAGTSLLLAQPDEPSLSPRLVLAGAWPVLCAEAGPHAHTVVRPWPRWRGPTLVVASVDGAVEDADGRPLWTWRIPLPPPEDRAWLWEQALGSSEAAPRLGRHRHRAGRIHDLGRLAQIAARVAGREQATEEDVHRVAREGHDALGKLAQLLPERVEDGALVVAGHVREELEALLTRARHREGLGDGLGLSARTRYSPGLRTLFVGPSGTGKTLAAGWLAGRLQLPLFRVDLASVVSKYIGETEQNLAELLARAEAAEVLLFFDEADSLFGKRTEVQHSTDRFANAQTNYLLQRIESYEGVVVLSSNSRSNFDPAFSRRLDVIVQFPNPTPAERRALWQAHVGEAGLAASELNLLATACDLAGGHVRNAVLAGAVRAKDAGRALSLQDLVVGLKMEYRKLGKPLPQLLGQGGEP
jgi:hypothetical protein